jgi:hypothetical protein
MWKASPCNNLLKEQPSHCPQGLHATGPPRPGPEACRTATLLGHHPVASWAAPPPDHHPTGTLGHQPTHPSGHCPLECQATAPPDSHLPAHQAATHQPLTTGGLQHHQTPSPNLPWRHIQTGLDAKGVTPEQL